MSCDDDDEPQLPKGDYENGIIISGEGTGASSPSITYVSDDFATVEHQIYNKVNSKEFGTYLQSVAFDNERAFIVTDNQNTITVVDRYTFEELGTITTDLATPRYMTVVDEKGYVTNWGTTGAYVAEIDLTSYTVLSKTTISFGPERIIADGGKLYVSHKGGYGTNNVISVIDIASKVVTEITVQDNPDELFIDNSGDLVVLSEGAVQYDASWSVIGNTIGAISKINTTTNTVDSEITFEEGVHPSLLASNGSDLYYAIGSKVFKMSSSDTALPTAEFIDTSAGYLYGMAVNNNNLFILDASFTAQSTMDIYSISSGAKTTSVAAPVAASKIYFN
ncbi:cell surface protein [Lutibacter sp. TH_r2]|uniref:YncE family protein n=1 Tax=Lutibacter sp. TH_r2 TaxID=3082083 RepID=UPI002954F954|nr:cell surface protein [Lutibacter sp. TH_r2]MDV7187542.1 cell surface protein [Lutibacter sp. TH_r2]